MDTLTIYTERLKGLERLKAVGIPVPDYEVVYTEKGIPLLSLDRPAPFGWTIRTCKRNGQNEIGLFYKNKASKDEVLEILTDRLRNFPDECYIIYPSWNFYFSFNIFKSQYEYVIEGKLGSQKNISIGKESPSFHVKINTLAATGAHFGSSNLDESVKKEINRAIGYIKKTDAFNKSRDYFEVAVTQTKEIFFYEYWNIDELSKK